MSKNFIRFTGLNALSKTIKSIEKDLKETDRFVEKMARRVEKDAKINAPKNKGTLASSIHSAKQKRGTWFVADGVDYGVYQEFGTSKLQGKFFLTRAMMKNKKRFIDDLKKLVK